MPRDALPPYKRVAAALRDQITSGELLPGEQIPPVPRLMETYEVSRNTALRALRVLKDEGLVTVEPGWGAFVAER
jgi:DNA-binding GntR family transcriptional regulator